MKTIDSNTTNQSEGLCINIKDTANVHHISDFVSWMELDLTPTEDVLIKLNDEQNVYLHFMYNLKDNFALQSNHTSVHQPLSSFRCAIAHDKQGHDTFMLLKAGGHYQISISELVKFNPENEINNLFLQFEKVFRSMSEDHYFIHTGLPNLELGEYVKTVQEMEKDTLADKLLALGYINILLSKKLKQFLEHVKNPLPNSLLSHKEIKRIQEISEMILENPEMNYPIDDLCRKFGLNAAKLQQGFKEMHGKTVCNFINHLRLIKAEEMLKTSDLNVSEIVYSLGWTSRSYFCKIFKQKYQCSPKSYQTLCVNA